MNELLVICGPTATGKTALAAALAKEFNGELLSADSRQVYRGMDLITNKERPDVPVWLYDVVDPGEEFSVSHWVKLARERIADIRKRKKLPIVVGGSGLYINALIHPFETIDVPPDKKLRERLRNKTVQELQQMTIRGNMNDSDWNNPRRLIRKIETAGKLVKRVSGESALIIGLTAPLSVLYKRIDERLEERVRAGMKEEAGQEYLARNEHEIARKQLTWFKKQKNIHWFDVRSKTLYRDVVYLIRNVSKD